VIAIYLFNDTCSRGSWVGIMTRLRPGRPRSRNSIPGMDNRFFSSPRLADGLWDPPSLLFTGYHWLFSWGSSRRGVNLTMKASVVVELSLHSFLSATQGEGTRSAYATATLSRGRAFYAFYLVMLSTELMLLLGNGSVFRFHVRLLSALDTEPCISVSLLCDCHISVLREAPKTQ
jgi:hypothetical protein